MTDFHNLRDIFSITLVFNSLLAFLKRATIAILNAICKSKSNLYTANLIMVVMDNSRMLQNEREILMD